MFEGRQCDAIRRARRLLARYDRAALRPPGDAGPLPAAALALFADLRLWCLAPAAAAQPLAVATLQGADAAALAQLAARLCLERDGSLQMAACTSAAARWALRGRTKLHEAQPWRTARPQDPWDSGYLRDSPAGVEALARFQPRRATLLVAEHIAPAALQVALPRLARQAGAQPLPLRLLVLGDLAAALPAGFTARHFQVPVDAAHTGR